MANAKPEGGDALPKSGRVNEVCKEWTVREDGALAYRLQNQEISEHYQGNKFRNAVVREDFPRALDEQLREQQLAEQAAAVYHQMLAEQEEIDNLYAKQLADKIEREERAKRRVLEVQDEHVARHLLLDKDIGGIPNNYPTHQSPQRPMTLSSRTPDSYPPSPFHPEANNYHANSPRRQALAMPLPSESSNILNPSTINHVNASNEQYLYTEPYKESEDLVNQFDRIDIAEVGLPLDEISEREIQEQKDALLARQLQQQEDASEQSQFNRDRLLAIEAQDKELAKLLQERERQKAKRARERAKQKALAKKQQQQMQEQDIHQIMPDDSYSNPADLLPMPQTHNINRGYSPQHSMQKYPNETVCTDEDINYSFPVDVLPPKSHDHNLKQNYSPRKNYDAQYSHDSSKMFNDVNTYMNYPVEKINNSDVQVLQPVRPTHLDLKVNYPSKLRYPDPECADNQLSSASPSHHMNIAMAIDPTYSHRSHHSVPYCDTSSSTVTTSTSSSSPGIVLPPPDIPEHEEDSSPVPPYMPIQGQRRTASLEKKAKKKSKDGCKQQ